MRFLLITNHYKETMVETHDKAVQTPTPLRRHLLFFQQQILDFVDLVYRNFLFRAVADKTSGV